MAWTEESKQLLTDLWMTGVKSKVIALRLGVSKSAITGQVFRMGLPGRPSPIRRSGPPRPRAVRPTNVRLCSVCITKQARPGLRTCSEECNAASRSNRKYKPNFRAHVATMVSNGLTSSAIAKLTNLTTSQVYNLRRRLRENGQIPEPTPRQEAPRVKQPKNLYQRDLYWKARLYGCDPDVEALSRAVKLEDPDHPGFRLVSPIPGGMP